MPERVGGTSKKKKKSGLRRFGGYMERQAHNLEDIATGFPPGIVQLAHAIDAALPKSPIPGVDESHRRWYGDDRGPIKEIGKAMLEQTKEDLRHPLRNLPSTALTVAGLLAPVYGTAARASTGLSAASKGAGLKGSVKAAARPKPATRKLKGIKQPTPAVGAGRYKAGGQWVEKAPRKTGRKEYELTANRNPVVRGIRRVTLDPLYERSAAKATKNAANPTLIEDARVVKHGSKEYKNLLGEAKTERGIVRKLRAAGVDAVQRGDRIQVINKAALAAKQPRGGGYAKFVERRTTDQRKRYADQLRQATEPTERGITPDNPLRNVTRAPLDLMRLSMYVRPRYYVQNIGGTAALLAHAGVGAGDVKAVREIAKSDPELYQMLVAAGGETGTSIISAGSRGGGRLGRTQQRAANLANRPEAHMRTVAIYKAAKDFGITDPAELKAVLSKPESNKAQLIMQRGNESVVDYSRYGGSSYFGKREADFVHSGIPMFYPMTKGFTRYAGKFPTEHPTQAGLIAALGQQGKEYQEEGIGGQPQPWFPYITPIGKDKTQNLQNIYPFSPGTDVVRQAAQMSAGSLRHPTLNLLQQLGPTMELLTGAITGRQLATGFEYDKDTLDTYGPLLTALGDTAASVVPFSEFVHPRASAAFGTPSIEDRLKLWAAGPGFVQRKTKMSKVRQPKKRPKRRKKSGSPF